ncbi:hypothetical protein RUM43_013114 [Polyplax serrata]|uniref:Uncharacterized protein n=1 Tax=Polyplax serrata TaxID=468196 RepID=A0AAN8RZ60_POLSC
MLARFIFGTFYWSTAELPHGTVEHVKFLSPTGGGGATEQEEGEDEDEEEEEGARWPEEEQVVPGFQKEMVTLRAWVSHPPLH